MIQVLTKEVIIRKLLAFLIAISLVIPLLLASQVTVGAATWMLNRQFYIDILSSDQVYQILLSDEMFETALRNYLSVPPEVDTRALEDVLQSILTEEYLSEQVDGIVNDLFDYMRGNIDEFDPVVDFQPVKEALTEEKQDEFLRELVAVLPVCGPDETPGFGGEDGKSCKPQGISDEILIENFLKPALPQILAQIPNEISLGERWQDWEEGQSWRRFLPGMALPAGLMLSILILSFIAVVLWYLTALIADGSWRGRLQWLGWMLMIPSLLTFLVGILMQSGTSLYWLRYGLARISLRGLPAELTAPETIQTLIKPALSHITTSFLIVGGICGGLALGLIVWGLITPREKRQSEKLPDDKVV